MSIETVRLLLYCDGMVEHGLDGIQYNQPPCKSVRLSTETRYFELVDRVYNVLKIQKQRYTLRLMWRSPTLHQKYVLHPIEEDDDVEEMLTFTSKFSDYRYIELYVFKDEAPDQNNVDDTGNAQYSFPTAQHHCRTSVGFPMTEEAMPVVQCVDAVTNEFNTDSRGIESDGSADDDYWPEHEDSDVEGEEDECSLRDDLVHETGCSYVPVCSDAGTVPVQMPNPQVVSPSQIPDFYHSLNLQDGGCVSTSRELPFNSQFWDSSMTEFATGMMFTSKDELKRACEIYHIKKHRSYNVVESKKAIWAVTCASSSNAQSCQWRLRATKLKKHGFFEITRYEGPHSCLFNRVTRDHKHISSEVISRTVRHIVEKDPSVNIEAIIATVAEQFHYTVSYSKAWRGKQKALIDIFGEWEPSYAKLPNYMLALQNANPGTVVCWDFYNAASSDIRVLNYVFWVFHPSIEGSGTAVR